MAWSGTNALSKQNNLRFFRALEVPLAQARSAALKSFWFVHKDPGLRLRFGFDAPEPRALARVEEALRALERDGLIQAWYKSPYEPEVFLFGGPEATAAVHRYFDADSALCMQWHLGASSEPRRISSAVLSLGVLVDLFERCVGCQEEVWDVWCNLDRVYGSERARPSELPLIGLRELRRLCGHGAAPVLDGYAAANAALAAAFDTVWRAGRLLVGTRGVLVSVAAFHWNRYAIDRASIDHIVNAAVRGYDPRRDLVGGALLSTSR